MSTHPNTVFTSFEHYDRQRRYSPAQDPAQATAVASLQSIDPMNNRQCLPPGTVNNFTQPWGFPEDECNPGGGLYEAENMLRSKLAESGVLRDRTMYEDGSIVGEPKRMYLD